MLLSRIIMVVLASLNIDILDDEQSVKPSHKQLLNKAGLKLCNIRFEDGVWVKLQGRGREQMREQVNVRAGDDEDDDEDDTQQFKVRPSVGTSSSSSRPTLESLQARMDLAQADIEYLKGQMNQFSEGHANIIQSQADILQGQANIIQMFQNAFPQHPPPS
ncbi:hypothetical protein CFOL_v3_02358 [Cephalotus follicularis]|uniref:Uncharacterized protein n=1 Tax=Cephalotus follicularis TaxID=3775 RepID=A0A1Q3AT31_CEPFO|nr:hypothetical protein CFOL_v3_02358 [Cephalotus follicularis]